MPRGHIDWQEYWLRLRLQLLLLLLLLLHKLQELSVLLGIKLNAELRLTRLHSLLNGLLLFLLPSEQLRFLSFNAAHLFPFAIKRTERVEEQGSLSLVLTSRHHAKSLHHGCWQFHKFTGTFLQFHLLCHLNINLLSRWLEKGMVISPVQS